MANDELERILDSCIAEIRTGRATQEDCLHRYPGHAPTLKPLLVQAARLAVLSEVTMPGKAVDTLEERLLDKASQIRSASVQRGPSVWSLFWSRLTAGRARLLPAAASLLMAMAVASTWAVSASASSLPGMALYPIKLAEERARLSFTFHHEGKAHLRLGFAERRLDELETLVDAREPVAQGLVEAMTAETRLATGEIEQIKAGRQAKARAKLLALADRQEARVLSLLQGPATEVEREALEGALEVAQRARTAAGAREIDAEPSSTPSRRPERTPTPGMDQSPIGKPGRTGTPTAAPDEERGRWAEPSPTPTRTPRVTRTRKPTNTPKPSRMERMTPRRSPSQTPSPTPRVKHTRKPTHTPKPTATLQAELHPNPAGEPRPTLESKTAPQSTRRSDSDPSPGSGEEASR